MAYDEQSFLNGLAAGLTVTRARPLVALNRQLISGTTRVGEYQYPPGNFDTFVVKLILNSRAAHTIEYEYGPAGSEYQKEFRRAQGSTELRTFYRVVQIPQALPMTRFHFDAYFYEPQGALTPFDSYFMAFPYRAGSRELLYPGSPEQVNVWMSRTFRGF